MLVGSLALVLLSTAALVQSASGGIQSCCKLSAAGANSTGQLKVSREAQLICSAVITCR